MMTPTVLMSDFCCCARAASGHAAECGQQFPPSDGDCHTPLPCEVRKGNHTTPRACSLHVHGPFISSSAIGISAMIENARLFASDSLLYGGGRSQRTTAMHGR